MIARKYYGKDGELKGVNLELSLTEAKQIRAALGLFDAEELSDYEGILEQLRLAIPKQFG